MVLHERCPSCGLQYRLKPGDHWAFLIFIDRIAFIFPLVAALYFRMYELGVLVFGAFAVGVIALLIPHHAESLRTLCRARLSRAGSLAGNRRTAVGERSLNETHAKTVRGATP